MYLFVTLLKAQAYFIMKNISKIWRKQKSSRSFTCQDTHTWWLDSLCEQTCYVTKLVIGAFMCDEQFETT